MSKIVNNTMLWKKNRSIPKPETPLSQTERVIIRSADDFDMAMQNNKLLSPTNVLIAILLIAVVVLGYYSGVKDAEIRRWSERLQTMNETQSEKLELLKDRVKTLENVHLAQDLSEISRQRDQADKLEQQNKETK